MKPKHTYCFYMSNGEHIHVEADLLIDCTDHYELLKEGDDKIFMQIFKSNLMAWEMNR